MPTPDVPALSLEEISTIEHQLQHSLARTTSAEDSVPILYNLMDLSIASGDNTKYVFALAETAFRAGDITSALDATRNIASMFIKNDTILDMAMEYAKSAPPGSDRDQTVCFVRLMKNQHNIRYADKLKKSVHLQDLLRQANFNPPTDIYDRIVMLHALCLHLAEMTNGELLNTYADKLGDLIKSIPSDNHALKNAYYVWTSLIYTQNGQHDQAIDACRKVLDEIEELDNRNRRIGRRYRSYDDNRYVLYTRMLENYEGLNADEIELYHNSALEMVRRSPRAAETYKKRLLPCIFYSYARKDYRTTFDLITRSLAGDALSAYRRRALLGMYITAAEALGEKEALLKTYPEYIDALENEIESRQQERYRELQVMYEVNDIRTENLHLQKEEQLARKRLWRTVSWICVGLVILLTAFVVTLMMLNRRKTSFARRLKASNIALKNESRHLRETEAQLKQARDEAQKADSLKTDFINNMSHEVKTPLQAIQEYSQMIIENVDESRRRYVDKFADRLLINCDMVNTIVNDVLQLSELHNSTLKIKEDIYDTRPICECAIDNVRSAAGGNITLLLTHESENFLLRTDRQRLIQILDNLLGNAIKFTHKGTVTLDCRKSSDGQNALFTVTDTGIGIPRDQHEKIFERFTKLDNSTPGVGLGLTISRMLAVLMGGNITVDSNYTSGARFILTLPVKPV